MEQRRLRLGDILDDYCPRERRVTNHVVVAMIEEDVRQTRCTTCDAEHAYKGAKVPRRRKVESKAALAAAAPVPTPSPEVADDAMHAQESPADVEAESVVQAQAEAPSDPLPQNSVDEGPVHRPLIRATLPRPEGIKAERPAPEFTIRQNSRGNGSFRGFSARGRGGQTVNGGRQGGGPRFGRGPQGSRGQNRGGSGFGRGPKKRSR